MSKGHRMRQASLQVDLTLVKLTIIVLDLVKRATEKGWSPVHHTVELNPCRVTSNVIDSVMLLDDKQWSLVPL